jgi:preprotein translocase subunit SecE
MNAMILLAVGLEYIDSVFQTIQDSEFSQYTIAGMKTLAVLFFLVNILKKYNEGVARRDDYTWGLSPEDLVKNFTVVLLVIFSTQILGFFDGVLVAIENQYRDTAPALLPLQMQEIPIEEDVSPMDAMRKAMALLYEALVTPLYGFKTFAFLISLFLWIMDLFIYPLFLAERYFLLGIMQAFFPLVLSLAVIEKFRSMAYSFFRLYAAVYMLVPAFFLVNVFINTLYTEITENFWLNLFGTDYGSSFFRPVVELGSIGFIVFLKFKLYRRAITFTLRLFTT